MVRIGQIFAALLVLAASALVLFAGCGSKGDFGSSGTGGIQQVFNQEDASGDDSGIGGFSSGSSGSGGSGGVFTNAPATEACPAGSPLSCYVNKKCNGGAQTTITGKVYDPAGKVPIYNVVVWVPNQPSQLPVITPGTTSCNTCDTAVTDYVTATTTLNDGTFTLQGVPTLPNLPLVVQIGKWRRIIYIPTITDCETTTLPDSGAGQARLPKNTTEGDMPQMALLTGGEDNLGCFLARMGVDEAEYGPPHSQGGKGRLDIYQGLGVLSPKGPGLSNGTAGDCTTTSCPLWASEASLSAYDIVLLACEGSTFDADAKTAADAGGAGGLLGALGGNKTNVDANAKQAMYSWLNIGGKVFATHFHYTWFQNGPGLFPSVANWKGSSIGSGTCTNCTVDTSFPKGQALAAWLTTAGGLTNSGVITLNNVADSVSTVNTPTSRWIYGSSGPGTGATDTKYLSFETPIGGVPVADAGTESNSKYCGKAVFSDLHAGGVPTPGTTVPSSCMLGDLSPQEKALEFLFFDLSACVQDDSKPVFVPPPPK